MGILDAKAGGTDANGGRADRPGPGEIWRTWLVTGARSHPIDPRRLQGEHRGLKQILAEGGQAEVLSRPWRDFSRAMVRQSVNEAMGGLTTRERVVVTMAYFAGFSNEEIAGELGMTVRGVQRSLRRALDRLSSALERGRRMALALIASVSAGRLLQWMREALATSDSQLLAAVVVAGVVVMAPTAAAQQAQSHHAASAPVVSQAHNVAPGAASSTSAGGVHPAAAGAAPDVAPPARAGVNPPPISVPKAPPLPVPKVLKLPVPKLPKVPLPHLP